MVEGVQYDVKVSLQRSHGRSARRSKVMIHASEIESLVFPDAPYWVYDEDKETAEYKAKYATWYKVQVKTVANWRAFIAAAGRAGMTEFNSLELKWNGDNFEFTAPQTATDWYDINDYVVRIAPVGTFEAERVASADRKTEADRKLTTATDLALEAFANTPEMFIAQINFEDSTYYFGKANNGKVYQVSSSAMFDVRYAVNRRADADVTNA